MIGCCTACRQKDLAIQKPDAGRDTLLFGPSNKAAQPVRAQLWTAIGWPCNAVRWKGLDEAQIWKPQNLTIKHGLVM